jgi:hypothetical protein
VGREIFYCFNCQERLTGDDLEQGRGFQVSGKVCCADCTEGILAFMPPDEQETFRRRIARLRPPEEAASEPAPEPREGTRSRRRQSSPRLPAVKEGLDETPPEPARRLSPVVLACIAAGVTLAIALPILFLMPRKPARPKAPEAAATVEPSAAAAPAAVAAAPDPPASDPTLPESLRLARAFVRAHPDDLSGQIALYEKAKWDVDKTPHYEAFKKELEALIARQRKSFAPELERLDQEAKGPLDREEFRAALDLWEKARPRHPVDEWTLVVDKKMGEVWDRATKVYRELKQQVLDARSRGSAVEAGRIRDRVLVWGLERYTKDIDQLLSGAVVAADPAPPKPAAGPAVPVTPPPTTEPPRSPEGQQYLAAWEKAMLQATARRFEEARTELGRAAGPLQEEGLKKEAAEDATDLAAIVSARDAAIKAVAAMPRGRAVTLDTTGEDGNPVKVEGRVVRSGPARVEVKAEKDSVFVELAEIGSAALAPFCADKRVAALLALVGGDAEAARKLAVDGIPPKWWRFAADCRAKAPKPDLDALRRELAARHAYYAMEREWRSMETRGAAIAKAKALANDHAVAAIVRDNLKLILRRSEAGRDYYFPTAGLKGGGTFKRARNEKAGEVWLSAADTEEERKIKNNFVEVEFYAMPDADYRAWVWVGGCCAETFDFNMQATHLTAPNPQDRKNPYKIEPGTGVMIGVKHSLGGLKKDHAAHAGTKEPKLPKEPTRWEWVSIALPKYPAPGPMRIRFLTAQKGFAVAAAVVSAVRKGPPPEAERADLEKAWAEEAADLLPPPEPGLVAHWTFDEKAGTTVGDASGNGHDGKIAGGAAWGEGKSGGGLACNGKAGQVDVPGTADLQLPGDLTIAFWMKKNAEGTDWVRLVGKGAGELRNYGVWEAEKDDKRVMFQQYNAKKENVISLYSKSNIEKGQWYHVAVTVSGGTARIYINGKLDASEARKGAPAVTADPVTIGHGDKMHGPFNGALDDVRIYNRALAADEIAALAN